MSAETAIQPSDNTHNRLFGEKDSLFNISSPAHQTTCIAKVVIQKPWAIVLFIYDSLDRHYHSENPSHSRHFFLFLLFTSHEFCFCFFDYLSLFVYSTLEYLADIHQRDPNRKMADNYNILYPLFKKGEDL